MVGGIGVVVGVGVVDGEVVAGVPDEEPELGDPDPVEAPVDPVEAPAPEVTGVDGLAVVVAVLVVVLATCCGVNGLRPRPASFESDCLVWTEIAGSAVPVE